MARRQLLLGTIFLDPFVTQTQSIDFDENAEALRNDTNQTIGIANTWSVLLWMKRPSFVNGTILHIANSQFNFGPGPGTTENTIFIKGDFLSERFRISIIDKDDTFNPASMLWDNQFILDTWVNFLVVWDGTDVTLHTNGVDQGVADEPFEGSINLSITQIDGLRNVSLGNTINSNGAGIDGVISQCALWRADVSSAVSDLYNSGNPNALDLNSSFGDYTFAGDLAHWWRAGHEASPNIGKDSSTAGFTPTIDIETDAVGITDADRVEDVPT